MTAQNLLSQFLSDLRPREREMTQLLGHFVRTESPSFDRAAVNRLGRLVAAEWRRRGARVRILPGISRGTARAQRGDHIRAELSLSAARARGQLLVLGHLDTVYDLGTLARMPFRVARGRAFGPGTLDMKDGLVMSLYAVDALRRAASRPAKRLVFLWTSDEEIGSGSSRRAIEAEARRSDAVFVLEPSTGPRGALKTARKGVGEFEITVTGRAAHAGVNPQEGVNAVHELALQIARVARYNDPRRGITVNADVIEGGSRTNVIADRARSQVDVRVTRLADARALEARFRRLRPILPGARLEVRGGVNRPPMEQRMSARLFAHAKALALEAGWELEESFSGGGSDGNFTAAAGVPTLDGLGGVGAHIHSPDEFVLTRSLPERAALLAALLATL
jgi:glutamate carboxypeptidase